MRCCFGRQSSPPPSSSIEIPDHQHHRDHARGTPIRVSLCVCLYAWLYRSIQYAQIGYPNVRTTVLCLQGADVALKPGNTFLIFGHKRSPRTHLPGILHRLTPSDDSLFFGCGGFAAVAFGFHALARSCLAFQFRCHP